MSDSSLPNSIPTSPQESLLARVQRLEDIEAIGRLKATYCLHCDNGFDPKAIASLFTEDGVWHGGNLRGAQVGRDNIERYFGQNKARIPFAAHLLSNQIIDVDGDQAHGLWRMLMPYNNAEIPPHGARWQVSSYDDDFVRVDGRWYFKTLRVGLTRLDAEKNEWVAI
jgi:hypothetical protein